MSLTIHHGDALAVLRTLPDASVNCCVTSPPYYGLRDYGVDGQIGLEKTPAEYIARLVDVFREVRRALADNGTLFVNVGDSYASGKGSCNNPGGGVTSLSGHADLKEAGAYKLHRGNKSDLDAQGLKPKDLIGIPWMLAFALRDDGWWLRQDIIWAKPNPMPESVKDRCTKAHEYIFMLSKSARYFYDSAAVAEVAINGELLHRGYDKPGILNGTASRNGRVAPSARDNFRRTTKEADVPGQSMRQHRENRKDTFRTDTRNRRSVWTLATLPTPEAHFATYPIELPELCIRAGCPEGGVVLDPFTGAGTTALACLKNGRRFVGVELNAEYIQIAHARARKYYPLLCEVSA